jgi:hypothetical protein
MLNVSTNPGIRDSVVADERPRRSADRREKEKREFFCRLSRITL